MASQTAKQRQRHHCDNEGCNKSYIRVEHLNRHRLTHQERAFACYVCKKPFTRNDLLQAHLRRHDDPSFEAVHKQRETTPPPKAYREESTKRTKAGWDSSARPFAPPGGIDFGSGPIQPPLPVSSNAISDRNVRSEPEGFPLERVIFGGAAVGGPTSGPDEIQVDPEIRVVGRKSDGVDLKLMISDECYQGLLGELPELAALNSGHERSLRKLFLAGFNYLDTVMPLFHRPTFDVCSEWKLVVLAVCSLGGILSPDPGARNLGLVIYQRIRGNFYSSARDGGFAWLMEHVPAVLIIEHISYYGLTYQDHALANVAHGMMIAVYTQSSFLSHQPCDLENRTGTLDDLWKYWISIETNIRRAYSVFTADIKISMHFMRPPLLSSSMVDLSLPSPSRIWQASTAVEWKNDMARYKETSKNTAPRKLGSLMGIFLGHGHPSSEYDLYFQDAAILDILIHAIGSEILDLGRAVPSASSNAIALLRRSDLSYSLVRWKSYFDHLDPGTRGTGITVSSLIIYHLISILLREGTSASIEGYGANSVEGWMLYISSNDNSDGSGKHNPFKVGKDACLNATNILNLYLSKRSSAKSRSFFDDRTAVIGCLVLTTYMDNVKQPLASDGHQIISSPEIMNNNVQPLLDLLEERASQSSSNANSQRVEVAMATAIQLVKSVREQIALDTSEICLSSTSAAI
ncbi:hypothetical protein BKA65DRAFT_553079 [Rhexocercosporidium sp. MPI-PUGE-AT-0058]|nr:hypothetical protein BKA65DRAFT_553079 [Rhexocercosporidium sp. MPI-PUGE-AT-0058]